MLTEERQLKTQVFLAIIIIFVFIAGVRLYVDISHDRQLFDAKVRQMTEFVETLVELKKKEIHTTYTARARYFLENSAILEAIGTGDRERLYALVIDKFKMLKAENPYFSIMHFHLPDGRSFLRVHRPESYGDDLSGLRLMVQAVHRSHRATEGFEVGKSLHGKDALHYRLAFPVFDKGVYLGALEFGIGSGQIVSSSLELLRHSDLSVNDDVRIALLYSSRLLYHQIDEQHLFKFGPYHLTKHSDFFERILSDKVDFSAKSQVVKEHSRTYLLQWDNVLLEDFNEKAQGTVLISFDITQDEQTYYHALIKAIVAPLIALMMTLLLFHFGFDYFMKKLMRSYKKLELQNKYTQHLLDLQENIIITTDGKYILSSNTAFLHFFDVPSLSVFKASHDCICDHFIEHKKFFNLSMLKEGENWVEHLLDERDESKKVVSMISRYDSEPKAFSVKISKLDTNDDHYVISFTDITEISIKSNQFEYQASHDELTRIYNRMRLNELFDQEIKRVRRYHDRLSVIMFDIDHFKMVNDDYGHIVGDTVLKELARYIQEQIREIDIFARWGGEEFMILTPHTGLEETARLAEKLRKSINTGLLIEGPQRITCSFGVTQLHEDERQDDILRRVDEALYEAKESGRDCVVAIA